MARYIPPIVQVALSDFSGPGSGWKLYFYATGTTTLQDTYSDSALTTANTNPVVADSAGRFGDIFLGTATYKVKLTDDSDVEIWTADPVDGASGASGQVVSKSAAYTVTVGDLTKVIKGDASAGAFTITLLDCATATNGGEITIKKDEADTSTNAVTIDGNASETINGDASITLNIPGSSVTLRSDGTSNWEIVAATNEIIQGFALQGILTPSQITADQNDYSPTGLETATVLRLNTDAARTLTGLAKGTKGQIKIIHYVGSNSLTLADQSASSTAANRFALGTPITLNPNDSVILQYDATSSLWRVPSRPTSGVGRGGLSGLVLSNNGTDANHDIDIAEGIARDSTNVADLILSSSITKQLDASWAVGTNAGGLDTGSIAGSTWYHVWLIRRSDTGVVDALFSTSATSPTMPANYDQKRRLGAVLTDATPNITAFTQLGDEFLWDVPVQDIAATNPGTSATLRVLSVPTGVQVWADLFLLLYDATAATQTYMLVTAPEQTDTAPTTLIYTLDTVDAGGTSKSESHIRAFFRTDTSAQIRTRLNASDADISIVGNTHGWRDRRGQDD